MDMRTYGTGSFDHKARRWRVKTENIKATINQLRERYGEQVPDTEHGSAKYWQMYLAEQRKTAQTARKATSPFPIIICALERIKAILEREGQDTSIWDKAMREVLDTPAHDIDRGDTMLWTDAVMEKASKYHIATDDVVAMSAVEQDVHKPVAVKNSLQRAIDTYIEHRRESGDKQASTIALALGMLLKCTSAKTVNEINADDWLSLYAHISERIPGERTRFNYQQHVLRFLRRMEFNCNVSFSFLKNPDYRFPKPDGQKVVYSLEQVQLALHEATGKARLMLLLGLNCGFYVDDVAELKPESIVGTRIETPRQKNMYLKSPLCGAWLLWEETRAVLE